MPKAIQFVDRLGHKSGAKAERRIQIRVTTPEDTLIRIRAAAYGLRVSDYLVALVLNDIRAEQEKTGHES